MAKYVTIGQIVENQDKTGNAYEQLVLSPEFLADAKNLISHAYLDKRGARRFSLFKPKSENAPKWVKRNVCVKVEE